MTLRCFPLSLYNQNAVCSCLLVVTRYGHKNLENLNVSDCRLRPDAWTSCALRGCEIFGVVLGSTNFLKKCRRPLKILGVMSGWSKFHTEDPQIFESYVQNLVARTTRCSNLCTPGVVHGWLSTSSHWLCLILTPEFRKRTYPWCVDGITGWMFENRVFIPCGGRLFQSVETSGSKECFWGYKETVA